MPEFTAFKQAYEIGGIGAVLILLILVIIKVAAKFGISLRSDQGELGIIESYRKTLEDTREDRDREATMRRELESKLSEKTGEVIRLSGEIGGLRSEIQTLKEELTSYVEDKKELDAHVQLLCTLIHHLISNKPMTPDLEAAVETFRSWHVRSVLAPMRDHLGDGSGQ